MMPIGNPHSYNRSPPVVSEFYERLEARRTITGLLRFCEKVRVWIERQQSFGPKVVNFAIAYGGKEWLRCEEPAYIDRKDAGPDLVAIGNRLAKPGTYRIVNDNGVTIWKGTL